MFLKEQMGEDDTAATIAKQAFDGTYYMFNV